MTRNRHGAFGLRALVLVLVMLAAGGSPAWAGGSWDKTNTDKGGGTYRFKGAWDTHDPSNDAYFETAKHFDLEKDQFYWDFAMRVDFRYLQSGRLETVAIDGYIYLVTSDNVSHQIAYWQKKHPTGEIFLTLKDERWGKIYSPGYIHGEENTSFFYTPNSQAVQDGVKRIIFTHYCYESWDPGLSFWVQYEKDITFSGIAADKPMPAPTIEWGDDGRLSFKATGVPDKRNNSNYDRQGYAVTVNYYDNGIHWNSETYTTDDSSVSISNETNSKMDMAFSFWPLTTSEAYAKAAYTVPVYVDYYGYVKLHQSNLVPEGHLLSQPRVEGVLVKPFTRPTEVSVEFDKWNKKNTVKWKRQTKVKGYDGSKEVDVECRYKEGKWYVVRYAKGSDATDYKVVGTLNGDAKTLQLSDADIEYDKEYVYRVIFLPTILESKFKDHLATLPGYSNSKNATAYDLWNEASIDTKLSVHITLSQDASYTEAVRLKWQYSIPVSGMTWYVEYKQPGEKTWREKTETIAVDPNQTEASADFGGTVCDPVTYRIKTKVGGTFVYSDTLTTRLASGSYIKNVTATTGTEEKVVKITWDVANPDVVNDISYRVKRRPIGIEEWTTVYETSDKLSHYECEDQRPQTGTYYEYTVEAYGAKCPEQLDVKMDGIVVPGFSQARGTITGHIAFGSGTAVQGVRVNLVKSSADQESDQVQYLSRYIEGTGAGLLWTADSAKYAGVFTGQKPATLQLWAKPSGDGGDQMALATLTNALQVGVKKVGSEGAYKTVVKVAETEYGPEEETIRGFSADGGTQNDANEGYDKLVDGNFYSKWCTATKSDGVYYCEFHSSEPVYVKGYTLITGNDTQRYSDRNPKSWVLKAKLNETGAWETIATVTDDQVLQAENYKTYTYATDKEGVYQYFRFEISDNQTTEHDIMQLSELQLITKKKVEKLVDKTVDIASVTKRERPAGTADTDYCLYAVDLSGGDYSQYKVTEFPNLTFSEHDFTHISAVYDGAGEWKFYVGTDSLLCDSITVGSANWKAIPAEGTKTLAVGGSNQAVNTLYKGHVDDIRLWARALKKAEVESNYTRILGGTEDGLRLYWPLDEGELVRQYAFDIACQDGIYQLNHPEVGPNAVPRKEAPKHLKLYGVTDSEGDYIIKGIPFQQGGTNYKVTPLLGVHEFSPGTRSMFISPTSLTANNIDFEDVSSFPMNGYVYYVGTNIPVEGVMIKVDGQPQSKDGELIKTDAKGHYEVSVPIGDHYVEAYLDNHTMVAGGRYPRTGKEKFIESVRYDFADSTLVNFVGRVAGGERNDTLGVGFGNNPRIVGRPSKNNIGVATIALKLNSEKLSFNCKTGTTETYQTFRTWESDTTSINSHSFTGIDSENSKYKDKRIYIQTDSVTGEFSALLPPLKYTVQSIEVTSNKENIEFTELPEIDLSIAGSSRSDSVRMVKEGSADTTWVKYKYHTKMVRTYYAQPQLELVENGHKAGYFGLEKITYKAQMEGEEDVIIDSLYYEDKDKTAKYLVGYPIYQTGNKVKYHLRGFEIYENRDDTKTVKRDTINLPHAMITVANEMSDEQKIVYKVMDESTGYKAGQVYELQTKQMPLDDNGEADLTWTAGLPNITEPYTRKFSIALERKNRTYNVANLDAVVLGELTNGSNFVTQGPDVVNFVLRDPQGAKSTTKLTVGKTTTKTTYDTSRAYGEYKAVFSTHIGTKNEIGTGVGLVVMSELSSKAEVDAGVHTTWEKTWNRDSTHVETTVENVATSSSKPYVGAEGDVYIGKSHNWLVGGCRRLFIDWNEEKKKYELKLEDALAFEDTITTAFKFTQYELENVMIPKWKDMRRSFLTEVATEAEARSYVNKGTSPVYLTWKGLEEKDYVEGTNYVYVKPESWKTKSPSNNPEDSVNWCSNQIRLWEQTIRDNEADKVRLMKQGKKQNISIDGGSSYSYSKRTSNTKHDETTINWKMGAILGGGFGFQNVTFVDIGHNISITTENGGGYTKGDGTITENYSEWDYTIEDGNRDTDLSLTIYESDNPKYSDFFSVFGGQTYNPYQEQEWTHYYKNDAGNYVALGNSTVQMEQPDLRIGLPGENSAKSVTVTDIPAGGEANVTLYCTNLTNAHQGVNFSYDILVLDETNKNGLQILMDGVPINGRSVYLEHSETTTKVLTIRQTDQSVMDFEGIKFWLASQYQPAKIHDEVTLNAHFAPSSSPVTLAITEPVVNCNTPGGELEMRVKDFNRQFTNLKNVGVQYRFAGNTQWTNLYTWWVNKADTIGKDTLSNTLMPKTGDLKLEVKMLSDLTYPEGTYEFRAFSTTPYGSDMVHVYSDVVNVVKDRTRPINLYTPAPANGILGYGDQLSIEFNEDIVPGYVGADNVIVTAKLNQEEVKHDVSLALHPFGDQPVTVNPVFMNGDFSVEFWLKWDDSGTILHQGPKTDNFALGINSEGRAKVTIAHNEFVSTAPPLPKEEWIFFALNYKQATRTFNAMASYGTTDVMLFTNEQVSTENVQAVTSVSDNRLYLGEIEGNIHSLALYNIWRDVVEAAGEKYVVKDNYVYGLANFWPFDEGHGFTAADSRHTHDFSTPNHWTLANENYALRISDGKGAEADISQIGTSRGESYAIELWYSSSADKDEVVFETATPTVEGDQLTAKLKLHFSDSRDLVLDYGTKSQMVASHENFDFTSWHHYALNVVRGQAASFYLDGQRTAVIPEADMVPIEGSRLIVGNNATLAMADEIRIWKAALSESRLLQNIYNTLDTASIYSRGLVAYYPFEKRHEENNHVSKIATLDNMAPGAAAKTMMGEGFHETDLVMAAPPLKNAPDEKPLTVTPIASERKVVINLTGTDLTPRKLEGTTLNITVDKIHDLHGNESQPIKWTAYVQQNTLTWMKDSVNIIKKYGDDYTFDVDIENKSGSTELYTLYNMPQWLSLVNSERTDDVSPLKTKTLRFEVNPLVPVGNYDVAIGLLGNNGILEPLRIVMKVRGEKPQWAVDPTKYDHQMTIIGQVYIGGILMENAESMVAAFINGECRGVAQPKQIRGSAYVTMNVYGNDAEAYDRGKTVSFRIWDASKGVAYTDANISVGNAVVYDNPKVELKYTSNGIIDNELKNFIDLRITDPDGKVVKDWFKAAKANTLTYPLGYTLEIEGWFRSMGCKVPINKYAFTLDKNMTIVCNLQGYGIGGETEGYNADFTAYIEESSDVKCQSTVVFQQDAMIGNFDTPAIWTKSENVEQLIPIHQNWNWIAFGVEPESPYLDRVFSELSEWQMLIKSRSAFNDYNGAEWGDGTLTTPKVNEMYKVKVTRLPSTVQSAPNSQIAVSGRQPIAAANASDAAKLAVTLQQGWNWIAYTPLTTMTIGEALAAANPQPGDIVKSQTGVAIYDINGWDGTLTALEGGHGYMYYSVDGADKSFIYPTATAAQARAMSKRAPRRAPEALRIFTPVDPTLYPNNMTMAIRLMDGEAVVDTCEVAAFVDGECRGATRASENGLYYLVISGDGAGQPMTLRTCLNGDIIDIDNTQQYVSDANIGTSWEPYVIDLGNVLSGIHTIAVDNADDDDWWTLQGFKIGRKPTQSGIYIHHGEKVIIKQKK